MKNSLCIFILMMCAGHSLLAQNTSRHDSLLKELKQYADNKAEMQLPAVEARDTIKANLLWELYLAIAAKDIVKGEEYINQLKVLSEQIDYKKGLGNAYTGLGVISLINGKFDQSMEYQKLAFNYRTEIDDKWGIACTYYNFGNIYSGLSNFPEALKNYLISIEKAEEINDMNIVADNYNAIGAVYFQQSDPDKVLEYAMKGYDLYKDIGDKYGNGFVFSLTLISTAYMIKKDYEKAIEYALVLYERSLVEGSPISIASAAVTLGIALNSTGAYDKALDYQQKAIDIYEKLNNQLSIANCYNNVGIIYLSVAEDTTKYWSRYEAFESTKIGNLRKAAEYFQKAEPIILESKNKFILIENYEMQSRVLELLGDYKNSLVIYKKFKSLKDSTFSIENQSKIQELETKKIRDLAQKESEINLLKVQRAKKERVYFIGGFVLLIALSATLFNRYRLKQRSLAQSQEQNVALNEAKKLSDELLLNILPGEVAEEIKSTGTAKAKAYTMVTVMFTDFKDFTSVGEKISAELLVDEIHECFSAFDGILQKYKIEKIKTIGDSYLCASGLPVSNYNHAIDMLHAAIEIRNFMIERKKAKETIGEISFELRIGIHTGPVVAGVVGVKKYAYDIWGDTVNIAARMEQNADAGKINISGATYELVKEKFNCTHRGKITAKNKGEIDMYYAEPA